MSADRGRPPAAVDAHLVTFYESEAELAGTVGRYLRDAVRSGAAVVVVAGDAHRRAFEAEMPGAVAPAVAPVWLDAQTTLSGLMTGERVDRQAFQRSVGDVIRRAAATGRPVRAYGEMVALLWEAGNVLGAIELEEVWNELAAEVGFCLLCSYRSGGDRTQEREEVCRLHTGIVHTHRPDDGPAPEDTGVPAVCAHLPAAPDAPRVARRMVVDALRARGYGGVELFDAQLVATEMATNAVVHARSAFWITAQVWTSGVRLSVQDASRAEPRMRHAPPSATSGRGLHLIDSVAEQWGVEPTHDGKVVWADLP